MLDGINYWAFAPPLLLSTATGTLTAQGFDLDALELEGRPATIDSGLHGGFSVSDNGLLLYQKGSIAPPARQLTWFDRTGKPLGPLGAAGAFGIVEISPRGDRVAMDITTDGNRDIWVIDVARAVLSRITFEPSSDWNALWSPDGSRFVFASAKSEGADIYEKSSTGVGNDQLVYAEETEIPVDWSTDGRYIVFSRIRPKGNDTWVLDTAAKKASAFIESPFDKAHAPSAVGKLVVNS